MFEVAGRNSAEFLRELLVCPHAKIIPSQVSRRRVLRAIIPTAAPSPPVRAHVARRSSRQFQHYTSTSFFDRACHGVGAGAGSRLPHSALALAAELR
ncbi:hypothetical protein EVAR_15006_1 [Eumeta japonica]|uniref:Uncharacterized protein n=1 Tax=Eumeta variegata TaxID=151549 RepID=A0A4C1X9S0_EUMVA|nr:hypothetical protein EVAR_15006_1 [Eumeta japonica]